MEIDKRVPAHAKIMYKGQRRTIWQREQQGFNGESELYEVAQRFDSVQGIVIDGDKILLPQELHPRREREQIGMFGGMIDEGEEPLVAIKREFLEEAGMTGDVSHWMTRSKTGNMIMDMHYYIIRNPIKIQEPRHEPGEKIELVRFSFEEFLHEVAQPRFRNSDFAMYIITEYILPGKQNELKELLFSE